MALRVLFFGTPAFALPSLLAIAESTHEIAGVVTQPDRPSGRGHKLQMSAIKRAAVEHAWPLAQPERLKTGEFPGWMASRQADVAVVAAYGRLLPQAVLDLPRLGVLNVHASLLPRWRGAAPIHRAILAGDRETGVTIMRVVLALDAGPMLAHETTTIDPDETSVQLEARLAAMGGPLVVRVLDRIERGPVPEEAQDESGVTYAAKIERADGRLDWQASAREVHNRIRGVHPWPLASVTLASRRLLLLRSVVADEHGRLGDPGTILEASPDGLVIAAGDGAVRVLEVQPEGRRAMTVRDFLNGSAVAAGDRVE
jgi:methionyl-tRNA formyltransferase